MNDALVVAAVVISVLLVTIGILICLRIGQIWNTRASGGSMVPTASPTPLARSAPANSAPHEPLTRGSSRIRVRDEGSSGGAVVVACGDYLTNGRFRSTEAARVGKDGEDRVAAEIERTLDSRWYVFRNVLLPGNNADLDIVLVGPGGTWVLEVKAYSGNWRIENGR